MSSNRYLDDRHRAALADEEYRRYLGGSRREYGRRLQQLRKEASRRRELTRFERWGLAVDRGESPGPIPLITWSGRLDRPGTGGVTGGEYLW